MQTTIRPLLGNILIVDIIFSQANVHFAVFLWFTKGERCEMIQFQLKIDGYSEHSINGTKMVEILETNPMQVLN